MTLPKEKPEQKARRLANEHWDWLVLLLGKVYTDAFTHGYKHGYKDGKNG